MVSTAATALKLFPRGTASTGEVGAHTCYAPGSVHAFTLRVTEVLAGLHFSEPFGTKYVSTDTRKTQSSVSDHTFNKSGPRATDKLKWVWEGVPWRGPDRDGRIAAAILPGLECSGIPAPLGRRSQAYHYLYYSKEAAHNLPAVA